MTTPDSYGQPTPVILIVSLQTYRFKVVPFGAVCSPFMLNASLLFHLSQYSTGASKDMLKNLYVDNIVTGCTSEEAAAAYYSTAKAIMSDETSTSEASNILMEQTRKDGTAAEPGSINVLGLQWDTVSDTMSLFMKSLNSTYHTLVTKREVLHEASKVFDPLVFCLL